MNKDTYAYLDGIPDRTSDLHNDAGFLNEPEVQAEIGNYLDIDDATAGQVLTMGESGFPEWEDVASGGIEYSTTEIDTGDKWIDGKTIYQISKIDNTPHYANDNASVSISGITIDNLIDCVYTCTSNDNYKYVVRNPSYLAAAVPPGGASPQRSDVVMTKLPVNVSSGNYLTIKYTKI